MTKVSLNSTTAVPASTTAAVTVPKTYSSFNVLEGTVIGEATTGYTHSGSGTGAVGNQFSFYALVDDETQTLTLNAGGRDVSIANVPLGPDKHVILEGDVAAAGWTTVSFTASAAKDWGEESPVFVDGYKIDADGTYIVTTAEGLQAWAKAAQGNSLLNCKLAADITLPAVEEGGSNWTTLPYFTGTFDGQGHTITGLTAAGGLFDEIRIEEATVQNLKLAGVKITAGNYGAGAIANLNYGTIADCAVEGDVNGAYVAGIGGIAGQNLCTITGCSMEGTVTNSEGNAGGIVGENIAGGDVIDCHSSATITGAEFVGGIAGYLAMESKVIACYSTGTITSNAEFSIVGGVVGSGGNRASVVCCYATGVIIGKRTVGGVIGDNSNMDVIACYYAGFGIPFGEYVGGVAGTNWGSMTACYWSGYDGAGIGYSESESEVEATKVDGETVSWSDAVSAMNAALDAYDWEWSLDTADPDALPTPVKKEAAAGE